MEDEMSNLSDASEPELLRQISHDLRRSLSLKTENNLTDFIVVFIDAQAETSNDNQLLISDLQSIINGTVYDFNSLDSSLKFIRENESVKIFLIISGSFGETHGHHFFELPQITCIYVFCHDRLKHENWAHAVQKIRGVFEDKTKLLTTVCREVKSFASRWSFLDESSFQKASTNDGQWYQLFIRVLIHQPRTENNWKEMLDECRSFYRQNPKMLRKIDDFEKNYTPDQALKYYCQDSFVYRIINCALRTHDINIIIKFQPYISDLYHELRKKYLRHKIINFNWRKTESPLRIVYRGQYMQEAELEQLKDYCQSRNSHIVLNTFGSATRDPRVALQFILDDCHGYIRCLYQIIIPDHYHITSGISSISCHQFVYITDQTTDEQEVLFSVGSVFCIKYIGRSTSEHSWVPIVLELHTYTEEFNFYWDALDRRIKDENDEMKNELLQFVKKYMTKGNELNWVKWWRRLMRECGIRKHHDESLAMFMYEGFDDRESIAEAIELRKRCFMINNPSVFQSEENSCDFFLREMKLGKQTRTIALYELFLQSFNGIIISLQYDFDSIVEAFQYIGDAYAKFHFYKENALNCYREALKLAEQNSNDEIIDRLQCKITKLSSGTSVRKFDYHTEVSKKERTKTVSWSEYETQPVKMADYETECDQWSILWQFHKVARGADFRLRAQRRLLYLNTYLREREKWIDNCDLRIFLRMPLQQEQKIDSPTDIYPFLFLAVWSHLHEHVNVGNYTLNLWRYEKFMFEWLSLNDVKRILTSNRCTDPIADHSILPTLNRLIEKLKLIVIWCNLMITLSPKLGEDCFVVNVNRIKFVEVGRVNVPKLVFFDDRDKLTKDTVRAELETFASCSNVF
jgi:hypothetical protein